MRSLLPLPLLVLALACLAFPLPAHSDGEEGRATVGDTGFVLTRIEPAGTADSGDHDPADAAQGIVFALSARRPGGGPPLRPYLRIEHQDLEGRSTILWGGPVPVTPNGLSVEIEVLPGKDIPSGTVSAHLRYRRFDQPLLQVAVQGSPAPPAAEEPAASAGPARLVSRLQRPGGTNVAAARYRTVAEGPGAGRLIDGAAEGGQPFVAPHGKPVVLRLLKPYPVVAVTVHLPARTGIGHRLRIESSIDGEDWTLLSDLTDRDYEGRIDLAMPALEVRFLRLTGLSSSEGAHLRLNQVEVITDRPVPLLDRNLAAAAHGGRILAAPVDTGVIPPPDPRGLIDGDTGLRRWSSPVLSGGDGDGRVDIDLAFGADMPARVEAVVLHSAAHEGAYAPARLALAGSLSPDGEDFEPIGSFDFPAQAWPRLARFPPQAMRRLRLTLVEPSGGDRFRLSEIEVHEAVSEGGRGLLDGRYLLHAGGARPEEGRNIADPLLGTQIRVSAEPDDQARALVEPGLRGRLVVRGAPAVIDLDFLAGRSARLEGLWLNLGEAGAGARLLIEAAAQAQVEPVEVQALPLPPVGRPLFPAGWYLLHLDGLEASRLRLILDPAETSVRLEGLAVVEGRAEGYVLIAQREPVDRDTLGPNLALAALGGRIKAFAKGKAVPHAGDLIDGLVSDLGGTFGATIGWQDGPLPATLVLDLAGDRPLPVRAIGIDGTTAVRDRDPDLRTARRQLPRRVGLAATLDDPADPAAHWTDLPEPALLGRFGQQLFALPPGTLARGLRLDLRDAYGAGTVRLGEIAVYGTPEAAAELDSLTLDLLEPALGGMLVAASSQDRYGPAASVLGGALEPGSADGQGPVGQGNQGQARVRLWRAGGSDLPQHLTFAFADWRQLAVSRLLVRRGEGLHASRRPARVAIETSSGWHPAEGFSRQHVVDWPEEGPLEIVFAPPLEARYLRLVALEAQDPEHPVALGAVSALAARPRDLLRAAPATGQVAAIAPTLTAGTARPDTLRPGMTVAATLSRPGDSHSYALTVEGEGTQALGLFLDGDPRLGLEALLRDQGGRAVMHLEPEAARSAELSLLLDPGRYLLELRRPQPQVAILVDDSGSMWESIDPLRAVLRRYLAEKPEGEVVSLLRFADSVSLLSSGDTSAERHLAALEGALRADGSTALYDGMAAALNEIGWRSGDRAILLVSDGADNASRDTDANAVWALLAASGVRLYAIALGQDMAAFNPDLGMSPLRMLEAWAGLTGGVALAAPDVAELEGMLARIAADLRGPLHYRLRLQPAPGEGSLSVVGEAGRGSMIAAPPALAILYDSSGSMAARDAGGRRRVDAARAAFGELLSELPAAVTTALVAFGHRRPREPKDESCDDIELVLPFGSLDRAALSQAVAKLRPLGQTPIGRSLALIADNLPDRVEVPAIQIIVITDGEETCDPDPDGPMHPVTVARRLRGQGVAVTVNVVGFDIGTPEIAAGLAEVARAGGGIFLESDDTTSLARALRGALAAPYAVIDAAGRTVARGHTGQGAVGLPSGRYRVELGGAWPIAVDAVEVRPGRESVLELRLEGTEVRAERHAVRP